MLNFIGAMMSKPENFNTVKIPNPDIGNFTFDLPVDHSTSSIDSTTNVYFRNIKTRLIEKIMEADVIFGCVSWIKDPSIIRALQKKTVMLVIQKEKCLKPQVMETDFDKMIRNEYAQLKCGIELQSLDNPIGEKMCYFFDPADPIVCVGAIKNKEDTSNPLMHNKFLIFARWRKDAPSKTIQYAAWTGSFNFSANASKSFENALYLTDPNIVNAYFQEFGQIWLLSEPIDWEKEEMSPFMYFADETP